MEEQSNILDEVMSSQNEAELGVFSPAEAVSGVLGTLNTREADVLTKRFNLDGSRRYTLEEIGRSYNITRERVRQIEAAALRNILRSDQATLLNPAVKYLAAHLFERGSVMEEGRLIDSLFDTYDLDEQARYAVPFILTVADDFVLFPETSDVKRAWGLRRDALDRAQSYIAWFTEYLKNTKAPVAHDKVLKVLTETDQFIKDADLNEDGVISYLELSKYLKRNPFEEWGLIEWNEIVPRGVKDKAYLVVKKHGKPVHFRDIAGLIDEAEFDAKKAHPQTVHNELIKDDRFVLVGRGMYALTEWGYTAGTVADVLVRVLSDADKPLTRDQLIDEVLKERVVKRNTIILSLQGREQFVKNNDGTFSLRQS